MQAEDSYDNDLTKSIKPRNFKCPCGKSYLSYAALFTHIKQKHEGKVTPYSPRLPEKSSNLLPFTKNEVGLPSSQNKIPRSQKKEPKLTYLLTVVSHSFRLKLNKKKLRENSLLKSIYKI